MTDKDNKNNAGHKPGHLDPQPDHGEDTVNGGGKDNGRHYGRDRKPGTSHALPGCFPNYPV